MSNVFSFNSWNKIREISCPIRTIVLWIFRLFPFFDFWFIEKKKEWKSCNVSYFDRFPHFFRKPEIQFYAHDTPLLSNKICSRKNIQMVTHEPYDILLLFCQKKYLKFMLSNEAKYNKTHLSWYFDFLLKNEI